MKMNSKENITKRYPGDFVTEFVYVWSGRVLLDPQWVFSVLVVLLI